MIQNIRPILNSIATGSSFCMINSLDHSSTNKIIGTYCWVEDVPMLYIYTVHNLLLSVDLIQTCKSFHVLYMYDIVITLLLWGDDNHWGYCIIVVFLACTQWFFFCVCVGWWSTSNLIILWICTHTCTWLLYMYMCNVVTCIAV